MKKVDMTQFNEKQIQAIGILSLPNRGGYDFDGIANEVGISVRQLHRWRKENDAFKQAIVEQSLENVKSVLPNVLNAHTKQAESGNVKAIELFYKLFGLLIERQEVEQTVNTSDSLSKDLDELKSIIEGTRKD